MAPPVHLTFLGGLGEIGRNCAVLEIEDSLLLIDCGLMFPNEGMLGVDLVLPDFTWLIERADDIAGCVVTHGHEDHVGALSYLLREVSFPLFGTELSLGLARGRIEEAGLLGRTDFHTVADGERWEIGPFDVEFIPAAHSVPQGVATAFRTPQGTILHTGDFKLDLTPVDGRLTDLSRIGALADGEGIRLLLADSTNADQPGHARSERSVGQVLYDLMHEHEGRRIITACFASHIHRIQQIADAAIAFGRVVAPLGRSMKRNITLSRELGLLSIPDSSIIDIEQVDSYEPGEVLVLSTGSQGEPMAALGRMANSDHPRIQIGPGDTVMMLSSPVPGNESSVWRVINGLMRLGATVVHQGTARVHVSGHASAGELLVAYNVVKPRNVLPVHGEWRHMQANADLAMQTGVPKGNVIVAEDGVVVDLHKGRIWVAGAVPAGYVYVDGSSVGEADEALLRDRRILRDEGFIAVITVVDTSDGKVVAGPEMFARGFALDDEVFDDIRPKVLSALESAIASGVNDPQQLQQVVRRTVGSWVGRKIRRRPMILPTVIEA